VKISAKTEYACIAMLELAESYGSGEPVRIRTIADRHGIPSRFLVQILLQLKSAGLVASVRGASGGYQLLRSPDDVSLADVLSVIMGEEPLPDISSARTPAARVLLRCWQKIDIARREILDSTTLADLVDQTKEEVHGMYYI
jgi:Rrf2 family protein